MTYRERKKLFDTLVQAMDRSDWQGAITAADRLREERPDEREWWDAILAAYIDGNDAARAAEAGRGYAARFPHDGKAAFYLGRIAMLADDWEGAEREFHAALGDPRLTGWYRGAAYSIYATFCRETGRPAEAAHYYELSCQYKDLAHGKATEYSNLLFNLHYIEKDAETMLAAAKGYGALFSDVEPYVHQRHPGGAARKIRIGYLSPDLRLHVVALFLASFLHDYDRRRFEVVCYAGCVEDEASAEFRNLVDGWRNVYGLPPEKIADIIHRDHIDILFDPAGHTAHNFLPVFAYRPAPVQVSGIGYFATTGLPAMDYYLADHWTDPPENDATFTEKLLRLPKSHFCFAIHDVPDHLPPAPFLRKGDVTFGSFNNFTKCSDELLALWAQILAAVPGSKLFLKTSIFNHPAGRKLALGRLHAAGITDAQLVIGERTEEYMTAYEDVDIALDTYPYPGGGTTCDALSMGVPVVTRVGHRHNARFGSSLLQNVGHGELCAHTPEEYVAIAVKLAKDAARLAKLHRTLPLEFAASPVARGIDYMGAVEQAYARIFLDWEEQELSTAARRRNAEKDLAALHKAMAGEHWEKALRIAGRLTARERDGGRGLVPTAGTAEEDAAGDVLTAKEIAEAWTAGAIAFVALGNHPRAIFWLRAAIARGSEKSIELGRLLAQHCRAEKRFLEGRAAAEEARRQIAECGEAVSTAFRADLCTVDAACALACGEAEMSVTLYKEASDTAAAGGDFETARSLYSSYLLAAHNLLLPPEEYGAMHLGYDRLFAGLQLLPQRNPNAWRQEERRIRVGYLSGDFRHHVMFAFYYQMLVAHDADAFELFAYSLGRTHDMYTDLVQGAVDHFIDVQGKSYGEIAKRIAADGIDILVDLGGHTTSAGLPVLAYRPAPVQVSGLGYMYPTGLSTVDWFLTDAQADGEQQLADWAPFHERPVLLTSQFCYTGRSDLAPSAGAPCARNGFVTFGVFGRWQKVTDEMAEAWGAILTAVPESRLLVKGTFFHTPEGKLAAVERLERCGIDPNRLLLEDATDDYMERLRDRVDILLDTYPYPGGGITCDALYMGVPVVSRYGRRRDTRFGLSILTAAGLGELACSTREAYAERAVALAGDRALLGVLHQNLRTMMMQSPLMDTRRYVAELERAYRKMLDVKEIGMGEKGAGKHGVDNSRN